MTTKVLWIVLLAAAVGCSAPEATGELGAEEGSSAGSGSGSDAGSGSGSDADACGGTECLVCTETGYWDFDLVTVPPGSEEQLAPTAPPVQDLIIDILEDGTAVIRDAAGREIARYPKAARNVAGQWVFDWKGRAPEPDILKRCRIGKIAKCFGVAVAMVLLSELANAGLEAALGPAIAQMGVRLQDCQDRFVKAAAGIACLQRQAANSTCAGAVQACPDAFFGANMIQSCGTEPGMDALVELLVTAIQNTGARAGGRGFVSPDPAHLIADGIRQGKFATDPGITCTMRASGQNCTFSVGSIFPSPPGFDEAKACWDGASRGVFESKWSQANKCCTTDACRRSLASFTDC